MVLVGIGLIRCTLGAADRTRQHFLSTWPAVMAEDLRKRQSPPRSAHAAEGISSALPGDGDQAQKIRELRRQVQDLIKELEAINLTQIQLPERDVHPGWSSDQWKSWKDSWCEDKIWTSTAAVGNWWDDAKSSLDVWQDSDR